MYASQGERGRYHSVGDWQLLSVLGKGSFATVYRAQHARSGHFAAIKAIGADKITQDKILQSLQSEINILRSVVHPNIVKLLDYERRDHDPEGRRAVTHYLVLEYCDGGDLADFLEARKRTGSRGLDEDTTRRLLRMLAMGLREMHNRNIVHRDLKPGNILLASQGAHVAVKIADFGFARALEPARLAHTLCGSPLYMAPEVLSEQQYDSRSDLWSVGVMMFEMLVGHVPFSGNNIVHLKKVIDSNEAFLPFDRRDQLSPACQDLVKRLLQKDPNRRLSFEAFFAHPFLSGQSIQRQPHTLHETEVVFEEPDSSVIEDDYVILSIPSPKDAMAQRSDQQQSIQTPAHSVSRMQIREDIRTQFERDAVDAIDSDAFMEEHASSMPRDLKEPQQLYAMAVCVAEVADWKLVNSSPAAAIKLSMLACSILDQLLIQIAPQFMVQQASEASSELAPGPLSPCCLTTAPTDDSDSEAFPLFTPHAHHAAAEAIGTDSDQTQTPQEPRTCNVQDCAPQQVRALQAVLRCVAREDETLCRLAFTRLHSMLRHLTRVAAELKEQPPGRSLPDVVPLVWQGMLSFGGSAALDEMFGAYTSAAKGYCKAAYLAELLRRQSAQVGRSAVDTATAAAFTIASRGEAISKADTSDRAQTGSPAVAESSAAAEMRFRARVLPATGASEIGGLDWEGDGGSVTCGGDDISDELLVEALQHQGGRSSMSGVVHGWEWDLDVEQQRLLREYRETIAKRHAACAR